MASIWEKIFEEIEEDNYNKAQFFIKGKVLKILKKYYIACKGYLDSWLLQHSDDGFSSLNPTSLQAWKKELSDLLENRNLNNSLKNYVVNNISKKHISAIDSLMVLLKYNTKELSINIKEEFQSYLKNVYQNTTNQFYYHFSKKLGSLISPVYIDPSAQDSLIRSSFGTNPQNYSQTTQNICSHLYQTLNMEVQQALASKKSPKEIQEILQNRFSIAKNDSVRMVRTYTAMTSSKTIKKSFQYMNIDKYEILATLDDRTSEICQDMDRQVFPLSEYQVGVTAPPFHHNCRTTIIPVVTIKDLSTRAAKDENNHRISVPESMTYHEWKKKIIG